MKYLIKDLARITGLGPARIRKWQERFGLLQPDSAPNGYNYYSNEDLFVLQNVQRRLEAGEPLEQVAQLGRAALLSAPEDGQFNASEWRLLNDVAEARFEHLGAELHAKKKRVTARAWNARVLGPLCELVGRGWASGVISVADEHAFSRWFSTFYNRTLAKPDAARAPIWLVVTHPEDEHELGALMHYGRLLELGVPARLCGRLPEEELFRELQAGAYRALSISVVIPRPERALLNLKARIGKRFSGVNVLFGGWGWRHRIRNRGAKT